MKSLPSFPDFAQLNRLSFLLLLGSGGFILLLWSPNVSGRYFSSVFKVIIFTLPWIMLWSAYHLEVILKKTYRFEIILMVSIIIFGVVNVIYSNNPPKSASTMERFLLTGIFAAWSSMFLITNKQRRIIFNWFCCCCFILIATLEIITFLSGEILHPNLIVLFTLHPIPTGTLMILLSPGPVQLILSESFRIRLLGYLALIPGVVLILLTQKRGTVLTIGVVAIIWAFYRAAWVRYLLGAALLAAVLLIPFKGPNLFKYLDPHNPSHASILQRLELYPYALHIWEQHPVIGIGLRSLTHEKYLATYNQVNPDLDTFIFTVIKLQTFDNMYLTSLVELGTLITLLYLILIIYIVGKYWKKLQTYQHYPKEEFYRGLVLLGFAIHSMTYDSLLFPPISWLFHVNLGILAAYAAADDPTNKSLPMEKAAL